MYNRQKEQALQINSLNLNVKSNVISKNIY